jgi:hypothetical protein
MEWLWTMNKEGCATKYSLSVLRQNLSEMSWKWEKNHVKPDMRGLEWNLGLSENEAQELTTNPWHLV